MHLAVSPIFSATACQVGLTTTFHKLILVHPLVQPGTNVARDTMCKPQDNNPLFFT